jgi:nucleoside-diphosphate-sugar epimerase
VLGNLLAMDAPGVSGEVFNLACGSQHTLIAIAEAIGAFLGRTLERQHVASRAGDVRHTKADITKIQRMMGYQPTVLFDEGMRRTCTYFVERFGSGR